MAPTYSFCMSTTYSRLPCDFQRIVFSSGVIPHDVTTVYEGRAEGWWSLRLVCWTDSDCGARRTRYNLGRDQAGLFYNCTYCPLNTRMQMTMVQHHNAADHL